MLPLNGNPDPDPRLLTVCAFPGKAKLPFRNPTKKSPLRAVLEVTTRAVIGGADPALAGFVSLVYKAFCEGHLRALLSGLG